MLLLLLVIATMSAFAMKAATPQETVLGQWHGVLKVGGQALRLVFAIEEQEGALTATMTSVDQGNVTIPATFVRFVDGELNVVIAPIGFDYKGTLTADSVVGILMQGGTRMPLNLSRQASTVEKAKRPQEPKAPFPYTEEQVYIANGDVMLAGSLTLPKEAKNVPAVVLVSGSWPQDRNEEIMGHKPFLVIADYLTRHGIAVLRYDDRGFGESTGNFATATTADFASDATAVVDYLMQRPEVDARRVGVIGHSEGGLVAPMVALGRPTLDFIVLMAGPGLRGDSILMLQSDLILEASGVDKTQRQQAAAINRQIYDLVLEHKPIEEIEALLSQYMPQERVQSEAVLISSPWYRYFLSYDPYPVMAQVACRVLALNGTKDLQVPYRENLQTIECALKEGGNQQYTIKPIEGLNHLFQHCATGIPSEYAQIEETISVEVLELMKGFVLEE